MAHEGANARPHPPNSFKRPKLVFSDDGNHAVIMDVEATDSGLALRYPLTTFAARADLRLEMEMGGGAPQSIRRAS